MYILVYNGVYISDMPDTPPLPPISPPLSSRRLTYERQHGGRADVSHQYDHQRQHNGDRQRPLGVDGLLASGSDDVEPDEGVEAGGRAGQYLEQRQRRTSMHHLPVPGGWRQTRKSEMTGALHPTSKSRYSTRSAADIMYRSSLFFVKFGFTDR